MIKLIYTNYIGKKVKYKTVSLISFMREYRKLLQVIDNRTFLTPQDQENDFFSCGSSLHFKMLILGRVVSKIKRRSSFIRGFLAY